jgi:hypothetical protein
VLAPSHRAAIRAEEREPVSNKLDPRLLQMVEALDSEMTDGSVRVDILLGLNAPFDDAARLTLESLGLETRSVAGDVISGTVRLDDAVRLAQSPLVLKLEAGAPMYSESPSWDGGADGSVTE